MKHLPKEDYIYMDCKIRLSKKAMSDLLYAAIITKSGLPTSWCMCYEYSREQNAYNNADVKVHIHPDMIERFEKESGVKLYKPISVTVS